MVTRAARAFLGSPVAIALATCLFFFQRAVLSGEVFLARDMMRVYLPLRQYWLQRVSHGEVPQWFPYDGLGQPFIPMLLSAVFHPAQLLFLLLPLATALKWSVLLCFPVSFLGVYTLARRVGLGHAAAVLAAMTQCFSGYAVSITNSWAYLMALATVPWVLAAALRLVERPSWARAAATGALLSLVLFAGDAQAFVVCAGCVVLTGVLAERPLGRVGWTLLAAAFAGALGAVELLPGMAMAKTTAIADQSLSEVVRWSLHPLRLLDLAFGPMFRADGMTEATQDVANTLLRQGAGALWVNSLYVGLPALVLAALGLHAHRRKRGMGWVLGVGAVLLVLALGRFGGLYAIAFRWVSLWRPFRYPEKLFPFVVLLLALASGAGFEALRTDERLRRRVALGFGVLAMVCGLSALGSFAWGLAGADLAEGARLQLNAQWSHWMLWSAAVALVAAVLCGGVPSPDLRAMGWGLATFAQLFFVNEPLYALTYPDVVQAPNHFVERILHDEQGPGLGRYRVFGGAEYRDLIAVGGLGEGDLEALSYTLSLHSTVPALWGIESADAYLPAASSRVGRLANEPALWLTKLLGAFNTRYVTWSRRMRADASTLPGQTIDAYPLFGTQLLRMSNVLPRAYVSRPRCVASFDEALARMKSREFSPSLETEVECAAPLLPMGDSAPLGSAAIVSYAPERVEIQAETDADCVLVLADAFYPGWTARVDGVLADILAANGAGRAVVLHPGAHRVVFSYETPGLRAGAVVSGLAWLAALILGLRGLMSARGAHAPPVKG